MKNIYRHIICFIITLCSISFFSEQANAQSCEPPMILEKGQCIPYTWAEDIVVVGTTRFNEPFFTQNIIPIYYPTDVSFFSSLPSPVTAAVALAKELNRRRKIHDCIARTIAQQLRDNGQWAVQEVTFDLDFSNDKKTARFDIVFGTVAGRPQGIIEVKTVLDYERSLFELLVRNQPSVARAIEAGTAIARGPNAASAGFEVNAVIGKPLPVKIIPVNISATCNLPKN